MQNDRIETVRLDKNATLPTRANPDDAGLDLYALENTTCRSGETVIVRTGVAVGVPKGHVGLVRDRSSMAVNGFKVNAGVIDAGYTGELKVVLLNLSGEHSCILKGQKFAQMLIIPVATPAVVEVEKLGASARGENGFGSSGV